MMVSFLSMRFGVFVECFPNTTVIGPISENGEPAVLDRFVVKDSLYRLPAEQLKVAESLFEVADR